MKKYILILLLLLPLPLFSIGYNTNVELGFGIAENLFSNQIEQNKNIWDNYSNFGKYLNYHGGVSADVIFNQSLSVETGIKYKLLKLNYITDKTYANDEVHLNFSVIQLPILVKYSIPVKKTVDVISSINISFGLNASIITGNQTYEDSISKDVGKFISPIFNAGTTLKLTYSQKIGPGKAFAGLNGDFNFIPQKYKISGYDFNIGNILTISPIIGYTFILKEDKGLTKITEKNKRIKDIDVN